MNSINESKQFFLEYGLPLIKDKFNNIFPFMCFGLVGHGSECFGYDDEESLDHDHEPGFCIFIPKSINDEYGFMLQREYDKLIKKYYGKNTTLRSGAGSNTKGVIVIEEFYSFYLGNNYENLSLNDYLNIPDYYLAEATNGEVFLDNLGLFTKIRNNIVNRPLDVTYKKLASNLFYAAQYGQYNYERCMKHHEYNAAGSCVLEFNKHIVSLMYLLNNAYEPYYKWSYKGLNKFNNGIVINDYLLKLTSKPLDYANNKIIIEKVANIIINLLKDNGLTKSSDSYLESHAYEVEKHIKDNMLRTSPIML